MGVVYIFNGNKPTIENTFSQRIPARSIRKGLSGFGYYISKFGEDLDGNEYNGKRNTRSFIFISYSYPSYSYPLCD